MVIESLYKMHTEIALHLDQNRPRQSHLHRSLKPLGFELHKATALQQAKEMVEKHCYRLALIHSDTAGKQICEFCSFIRKGTVHAIIIVLMVGPKLRLEEQLFDCGVNDVVTGKQASCRVLTKRIKAHLYNTRSPWPQTNTIRLKDTFIDFDRREVRCNGTIRRLAGILTDLLKYFLQNPNRVISREELLHCPIWVDSICSSAKEGGKTFDVNMSKLRKVIEPDPSNPQIIKSVRGVGWKLATDYIQAAADSVQGTYK